MGVGYMYEVYTVIEDETISDVAKKVGTSEEELYKLNGFPLNIVFNPDMMIVVPKKNNQNFMYYTVKKGDTLYGISKKYGIDSSILLALNGLDEGDYIYPNQTLIIPNKDIDIYFTKGDDTIGSVIERGIDNLDNFMKENENVCLKEGQIVIFRNK